MKSVKHIACDRSSAAVQGALPDAAAIPQSSISTSGEAQRRRILEMLRTGPKTTLDFRRAGVMQSQTRIHELRARGFEIPTIARITTLDDQGFPHNNVALYELIAEVEREDGQC
ncbi:MAG: helix-turn-helix domain-containing protein [Zoogloea sp.]|nr:helix-turn-helix domain-containing protein [Zoogloea sp.]MCA0187495.1 helix-turn-helix domain-containing protein [Pseudomonadota bacterium]